MTARLIVAALFSILLPARLVARQEPQEEEPPNEAAVFIGATTSTERDETNFTLGGDYVRHLGERWSAGGFAEAVFTEHTTWILGGQIRWHVRKGFWLAFEPALELATEEPEEGQEVERETNAIFRIGSGYDFEVGKYDSLLRRLSSYFRTNLYSPEGTICFSSVTRESTTTNSKT